MLTDFRHSVAVGKSAVNDFTSVHYPVKCASLRFVRRRGCRKQTLSADGTCPQPSSPAPSDHVSSSAVLGCLNVRSLLRQYDDVIKLCRERRIDLLCLTETWHDADSAVLGRLRRAGYNVVEFTLAHVFILLCLVAVCQLELKS